MGTIIFKPVDSDATTGTSLVGEIHTTFDTLAKIFGAPNLSPEGDKTRAVWRLQFSCGTVATIYDWKNDTPPRGPYLWHVGGKNHHALALVAKCLVPDQHVVPQNIKAIA